MSIFLKDKNKMGADIRTLNKIGIKEFLKNILKSLFNGERKRKRKEVYVNVISSTSINF